MCNKNIREKLAKKSFQQKWHISDTTIDAEWDFQEPKDNWYRNADQQIAIFKEMLDTMEKPTPKLDIHIWRDYSPDMAYETGIQDFLDAIKEEMK